MDVNKAIGDTMQVTTEHAAALWGVEEVGNLAKHYATEIVNLKVAHATEVAQYKQEIELLKEEVGRLVEASRESLEQAREREDSQSED